MTGNNTCGTGKDWAIKFMTKKTNTKKRTFVNYPDEIYLFHYGNDDFDLVNKNSDLLSDDTIAIYKFSHLAKRSVEFVPVK